jgi:hypothetical protein
MAKDNVPMAFATGQAGPRLANISEVSRTCLANTSYNTSRTTNHQTNDNETSLRMTTLGR